MSFGGPKMHMLSDPTIYQLALTAVAALVMLVSYALEPLHRKAIRHQTFIGVDDFESDRGRTVRVVIGQLSFAVIVFAVAWLLGGVWFDFFAGGYLVSSLIGLMLTIQNILYFRGLHDPGAASGRIEFSHAFGYKSLANRMSAAGLLVLCLFGLFGHLHFLGGSLIAVSTSLGYHRRARQTAAA